MHRAPSTGLRVRFQHQVSTQLLGAAVPGSDADVAQALVKITEDEQKQRLAEAEFKRHQASTNNEHWPVRSVSAYGGTHEGEDVYLIARSRARHTTATIFARPHDGREILGLMWAIRRLRCTAGVPAQPEGARASGSAAGHLRPARRSRRRAGPGVPRSWAPGSTGQ